MGRVAYDFKADFNERVERTDDEASASKSLNIGYFYLQEIIQHLKLKDFFSGISDNRKIKFDCCTIMRILTYIALKAEQPEQTQTRTKRHEQER